MLLALAGLKGGTGRTTLAVALAAEARARGRRTLLVDLDPRGDAHAWSLGAGSVAPTTLRLAGADAGQVERLRALAFGHDLTVLDTPADAEQLACVAEIAELILIPCRPSPMDAWAAVDTVSTCLCAPRTHDPTRWPTRWRLQVAVVPNAVDPRTTIGAALPNDLRTLGLPVLECSVARRIAHSESMAHGSTASLDAPGSAAARDIHELLDTIEAMQYRYGESRHLHH